MAELRVRSGAGDYDVLVGPGVRAQLATRLAQRNFLVTDENVTRHWGDAFEALLKPVAKLVLPAGEASKSLATAERIWRWLANAKATRADTLVALGGGVVGDVAGFAASTFHRGVPLVHVPTTLLAQVDSSIGGKVAIDLPEGKNLVGAFHAPTLVIADTETLATLPERELWNGLAELVKTALIGDAPLFAELERELAATPERIAKAAQIKAEIVSRDEHDRGERMHLNFGHTFGHALEAATGYGPLLHGEAIVLGMRLATALSAQRGFADAKRVDALLARFKLPHLNASLDDVLAAMKLDKKGSRFILLESIGKARIVDDIDLGAIRELAEPLLESLR
ncbi:MAG: 3-dehydroquinate synthase [Deltaproteobacteria bacterium]|nr:3-dehydroquinate synthase [Deltaproteobacteria bacterium]